jgi:hypothetical protein
MSKHTDKINAMKLANDNLDKLWLNSKITPAKDEELMKQKIAQLIPKNRKKPFSFFR